MLSLLVCLASPSALIGRVVNSFKKEDPRKKEATELLHNLAFQLPIIDSGN